jgi:hypothetical protein
VHEDIAMIKAKTPTVRKPKFEANQIQRTKPIGKPTRKATSVRADFLVADAVAPNRSPSIALARESGKAYR